MLYLKVLFTLRCEMDTTSLVCRTGMRNLPSSAEFYTDLKPMLTRWLYISKTSWSPRERASLPFPAKVVLTRLKSARQALKQARSFLEIVSSIEDTNRLLLQPVSSLLQCLSTQLTRHTIPHVCCGHDALHLWLER